MKKIISFILLVCMSISVTVVPVSAQLSVYASYDILNSSLAVTGDFGSENGDVLTSLTVSEYGDTFSDTDVPPLLRTYFTDKTGKLNVSLPIPASFDSGKYTVKVSNKSGTHNIDFLYAKESDIREVMLLLNDATSATEVSGIIGSNYSKLALDPVLSAPYLTELSNAYHTICGSAEYTDVKVFYSDFMQCLAGAKIKCGDNVLEVLRDYKIYIGSEVDEISSYPQAVQTLLTDYIKNSSFADGLLSEQLPKLRVLSFFKSSANWGAVKFNILGLNDSEEKYIDNFDVLNPTLTYYNQIRNKNGVYERLCGAKDTINSFDLLKSSFEKFAEAVYKDEQKNAGGFGGGSSSSSGGASVPSASYNPSVPGNTETGKSVFNDVNSNHWAKNQIEELSKLGVISGYPDGSYGPENNVSRAEFSKMFVVLAGLKETGTLKEFSDVSVGDWFYTYVCVAEQNGLITGTSESTFSPYSNLTRQDACVIIYRYIKDKISLDTSVSFTDSADVSEYASDAVAALAKCGIFTGYTDGSFKPLNNITRAETAVILSRVIAYLK